LPDRRDIVLGHPLAISDRRSNKRHPERHFAFGFPDRAGCARLRVAAHAAAQVRAIAGVAIVLVMWLDVRTHMPPQNPSISAQVYEPSLVKSELAMNPNRRWARVALWYPQ